MRTRLCLGVTLISVILLLANVRDTTKYQVKNGCINNPVIHKYTYHDASLIQGDDGWFYSFASSVMPRDTAEKRLYYTVSIFRSKDLTEWHFYKYAFDEKSIVKSLVNDYDKNVKRNGKFPYRIDNRTKHYAICKQSIFTVLRVN